MELQRTLVVGDIHGGYKALLQVFERAGVSVSDKLIFLGDYVDGWSEADKVIDFLIELKQTHDCVFLRGNHEGLLLKWLVSKEENKLWEKHGGNASMKSYSTLDDDKIQQHIRFINELQNYYIDDQNRLFVHAGFTNPRGIEAEFFEEYLHWDRTLWEMVMAMDVSINREDTRYPKRLQHHQEIYIGHTPVTNFGFTTPTNFANVWNIDTGAAFLGCISVLDVDTKLFWQSDRVADFYSNEQGRNHNK